MHAGTDVNSMSGINGRSGSLVGADEKFEKDALVAAFKRGLSSLAELEIGESATVEVVGGSGALRQHFLDMGVIPGAQITFVKYAPMGDPLEFKLHGYELTLRVDDARKIAVGPAQKLGAEAGADAKTARADERARGAAPSEHPGLGEGGRYHLKADERPLPDDTTLQFALAGNQNCGKTTLFNQLTGANQHVGNFPGVTVDRKDGAIRGHVRTNVVDLPGIYSMSPYTDEEIVSRNYILDEQPQGIINIVDATNIERNLYLTMQLMELDRPMVLALNMMDELQGNGGSVRVNRMEELLGIPVVPIVAARGEGVDELVEHALHVAHFQERPGRQDFCSPDEHGGAVHRALHSIMHLIADHAEAAKIPVRFAADKLCEGDSAIVDALKLDTNEQEAIEHIVRQMEAERGLDRAAAIADMRFNFIQRVVAECVVKPRESREHERSRKIDVLLTGKWTAIPTFVVIMGLVFWLTFDVVGKWLQDLVSLGVDGLVGLVDGALSAGGVNPVVHSLVVDGVLNGVGTVLPIAPIIVTMFFFLSLLEDTGYMARVAFVMDKLLRRIGLSGRSIVPMLMGFGCTVPAVMATRTLPSERDRKLTILLTPFMSCSTKLTIYSYFIAAFFPSHGGAVMLLLYLLGIAAGVVVALISHKTAFKGEAVPFVMELPNYRMPSLKSVLRLMWDKTSDFLARAFTVVFVAAVVVWFLQSFSFRFDMVTDPADSILAAISGWLSPLFAPLGFADWRATTSLIVGFMAKETVVSTLSVLFGSTAALSSVFSPLTAFVFLVFCLLYTPCVAAVAAIKRELGGPWSLGIVVFQCVIAWTCALVVRLVGMALGLA